MKTILEVFYVRIMGQNVRYQRKETNLSRKGSDPDKMIWSLIRQEHRAPDQDTEEQEFIVHSTSWRYEKPGKVVLTYVAYSDELKFEKGKARGFTLKKLKTIIQQSPRPASELELEKKIVSHALRHIAFLIQSGDQDDFKRALAPQTIKVFERIWVSLAGRVF